jgi:hypothetical protein
MNPTIGQKESAVSGAWIKTARLRHEWCDFLEDPAAAVAELRTTKYPADILTFVRDFCDGPVDLPFRTEKLGLAVLAVSTFARWWEDIGFKTRNKVRKSQKSGVELRIEGLTDEFARGVEAIYGESPVRQGRSFVHYGQSAAAVKEELGSFLDRSVLVGAYHREEMIGFMKLFRGNDVLRTIHIVAKISHREKCAMDGLIAKGVELCDRNGIHHLHYGSWTDGGIGAFREKHLFQRREVPRYFVPLSGLGQMALALNLQRPLRQRLPRSWVESLVDLRTKWNALKPAPAKPVVAD